MIVMIVCGHRAELWARKKRHSSCACMLNIFNNTIINSPRILAWVVLEIYYLYEWLAHGMSLKPAC